MRIPEERLVYLHCSFIFTGTNAEVRKLKKITQILLKHKASIRNFLDEFGLGNVSVVAKKLLKERVFESRHRAELRFPELFQRSEAEEIGGTGPEAEVVSFETEAAHEALGTSEEEDHDYLPIDSRDNHDGSLRTIRPEELSPRSRRPSDLLWTLRSLHLPFGTQHRILTFVQSTLEECCLYFGQIWAPHVMKAQNWYEPESIELTEWIKKFSKCTKDLPRSATRPIGGKSLNQVLVDTSRLRHTAVHRVPTSVEGIMGMLHAAQNFALALKDTARSAQIKMIEEQLTASINTLFQGQGLLQYKISGQLEVTAKGRTELDKLEPLWTTNVRGYEGVQRTEAASAIKGVTTNPQRDSSLRSLNYGGKHRSTVSIQATLEDGTLKTGRVASLVRLFECRGS